MREVWKDSRLMLGYEVSNLGNARKKGKTTNRKLQDNGRGYKIVSKRLNGKSKNYYIHILVADAFLPNPENKPEINHKFGDKSQNIVDLDNLYGETTTIEWATRSENMKHAIKTGLKRRTTPKQQAVARETLKKITPEAKERGRKKRLERYWKLPEEERRRRQEILIKNSRKKVIQYDLQGNYIATYNSIKEAGLQTNTFATNITACCKGKIKQIKGFVWRYVNEN